MESHLSQVEKTAEYKRRNWREFYDHKPPPATTKAGNHIKFEISEQSSASSQSYTGAGELDLYQDRKRPEPDRGRLSDKGARRQLPNLNVDADKYNWKDQPDNPSYVLNLDSS